MGSITEVDEALDGMTPQELTQFEGELDKQAMEAQVSHLYNTGVRMAREAAEHYEKTGELPPVLIIAQAAAQKAAADPVGAELDKMSAEELVQLEKELDSALGGEKVSQEYAEKYLEIGRKMAREAVAQMGKEAAPQGATFQGAMISKLAAFLGGSFSAGKALVTAAKASPKAVGASARSVLSPMSTYTKPITAFARQNPMIAGAAMGVGGTLAARNFLGDKN